MFDKNTFTEINQMIWIVIIGVIFYRGAKKRLLPSYLWALIGVGSAIAGLLIGLGIAELLFYFFSDFSDYLAVIFPSVIVTIIGTYIIMHYYAKKINGPLKKGNEELLDDSFKRD